MLFILRVLLSADQASAIANEPKETVYMYKSWNVAKHNLNIGRWVLDRTAKLPLDIECIVIVEDNAAMSCRMNNTMANGDASGSATGMGWHGR